MNIYTSLYILLSICTFGYSQNKDSLQSYESSTLGIAASVWVDDIVISASRKGFDIEDFILLMKNDTTLYTGFKKLRTLDYDFPYEIRYYNKKGKEVDHYQGTRRQHTRDSCRWNEVVEEDFSKRYYRRKKYRYYTSSLFSKIFYTKDTVCTVARQQMTTRPSSAISYQIDLMKKIIFSPGLDIDLPFVGRKMALFSEKMRRYYNYSITSTVHNDRECYLFSVEVKPRYSDRRSTVMVRKLDTYFSKEDFAVVHRTYHMKYDNRIYDFDIHMDIEMSMVDGQVVPKVIKYDGSWDIPFKKEEIAIFKVYFDFK